MDGASTGFYNFQGRHPRSVDGFGGLVVSMLASGTQVCGFKPGRKNPQHTFLRRGSKRICPMSQLCGM